MGQNCCKTIQPENTAPLLVDESSVTKPILVAEQAEHASIDSFVLSEGDNISAVKDVEDSEDNPLNDDNEKENEGHLQKVALSCFCGKTRTEHQTAVKLWLCHQCWKMQTDSVYYECGDFPHCTNLIGDKCPIVCAQCAFVQHDAFRSAQEIDDLTILKAIEVALDKIEHEIAVCAKVADLGEYLSPIKGDFHDDWCSNLETMEIGKGEEFKSLMNQYGAIMDEALQRQQIMIDTEQLGINANVLQIISPDNNTFVTTVTSKELLVNTALKWKELNDDIKESEVAEFEDVGCSAGSHCGAWRRMLFISHLFEEHFLKPLIYVDAPNVSKVQFINLFVRSLSGYEVVSFLDDLHHIQSMHYHGPNAMECQCNGTDRKCAVDLMRNYRARERGDDAKMENEPVFFEEFMNGLHEKERMITEIATKMHEAMSHRMESAEEVVGDDDDQKDDEQQYKVRSLKWWKNRVSSNQSNGANKFVNEIVQQKEESDEKEGGRMDELENALLRRAATKRAEVVDDYEAEEDDELTIKKEETVRIVQAPDSNGWTLITRGSETGFVPDECLQNILIPAAMSRVDCHQFIESLVENQYDSETVLADLEDEDDAFNEYPDSNLFPMLKSNKFLAKLARKHLGGIGNDDDVLPEFSFGEEGSTFYHWKYYKDWNNYNQARHPNLKAECLSNTIYPLSAEQFASLLTKAILYRDSKKGRSIKAMDRGGTNNKYNIPANLPLTVSHIVVLLMYCNYTELQKQYKKLGCRDSGQTKDEYRRNNSEIGNWYRLIFEAVEMFGKRVNKKNVFFTGLNIRLSFNTFAPIWYSPFSSTVSLDVAKRFMAGNGIILKLKPTVGATDAYFNVEWLSDFDHEKERLFVKADDLQIIDIRYVQNGELAKNGSFLRAFTLFSTLFRGHFIGDLLRERDGQQKAESVLLDLIGVYKETNNIDWNYNGNTHSVSVSLYIQQLFFNLLKGFSSDSVHFVIKTEFEKLCDGLKAELFQFDDDEDEKSGNQITLSPFLDSLCNAQDIRFCDEYFWVIYGQQFEELQRGKELYSDERIYKLDGSESITFVFVIERKGSGSNKVGFRIEIKQCPSGLYDGEMSVWVDEVEWYNNGFPLNDMKVNSFSGFFAFNDKLVDKVDSLTVRVAIRFLRFN